MGVIKGEGMQRIAWGRVIKDAEYSTFGEKKYPKTRFTVAISSDRNDKNGLLQCSALFDTAKACARLVKGDYVLVGGTLESWKDREEKTRWTLNVEFCTESLKPYTAPMAPELEGFEDITDSELPF